MDLPITGPRVLLRAFVPADAEAAHRIYGDPEVMRWVGDGPAADVGASAAMLDAYIAHQARHGFAFWAVVDRATGTVVGDAGLVVEGDEVHLGYTLGRAWWGRGLATEAAGLVLEAAFGPLGLHDVRAVVRPANVASVRVLEKLGFLRDGTRVAYRREHLVFRAVGPVQAG